MEWLCQWKRLGILASFFGGKRGQDSNTENTGARTVYREESFSAKMAVKTQGKNIPGYDVSGEGRQHSGASHGSFRAIRHES